MRSNPRGRELHIRSQLASHPGLCGSEGESLEIQSLQTRAALNAEATVFSGS